MAIALAACATSPPAPVRGDQGTYDWEKEGRIPPVGAEALVREPDHVDSFEDLAIDETPLTVESVAPVAITPDSGYSVDSTAIAMPGYRIQVFASGDRSGADRVRDEASAKLNEFAYVALVDGLYKVQVGDCPTRVEAEKLLQECRAAGYTDAWVSTTKIRMRRQSQH
jgi:hypothetical protein